jgi:hypothetical protein
MPKRDQVLQFSVQGEKNRAATPARGGNPPGESRSIGSGLLRKPENEGG